MFVAPPVGSAAILLEGRTIMGKGRWLAILAGIALAATSGLAAQVTIYGTNTFPSDVNNVQSAVLVPGAKVYLSGVFNFGDPDQPGQFGQVVLTAPGVTLQGVLTGATIRGGFCPLTTVPVPVVEPAPTATAKNLTIRNIRFEGWRGHAIYHRGVQDEDNITRIEGNTFVNTRWPADDSYGIHYCTGGGKAFIRKNRIVGASLFAISTHDLALHKDDWLIIEGNRIEDAHLDPLVVEVHNPVEGDIESGPVIVKNNRIQISSDTPIPYIWGISLGTFYFGCAINNAVVEGNVITGHVGDGIVMAMYGHGRKVLNNDLSGMTAAECQIWDMGRRDVISGNKLGPVETTGEYGNPLSFGIGLIASDWPDWYPPGLGSDPEPVTKNLLMFNDYRKTGLKGWTLDAAGNIASMGCVLLLSFVDMGWLDWWPGCEVTGNLIWEIGKFPPGQGGPNRQVLEYPIHAHDNKILGQTPGAFSLLASPGLVSGRASKASGTSTMAGMAEKLERISKIKKEMGEREGRMR
jgi:hypothetical protein